MAAPVSIITNPLALGELKAHHYANDDCIIHPIDDVDQTINDKFLPKQHLLSFDYVHELEFMRDSLSRILQQQKIETNRKSTTKRNEADIFTENTEISKTNDMSLGCPQMSSRVLHLLKGLETCLEKAYEPEKQSKLKYLSAVFSQVSGAPIPVNGGSFIKKDKATVITTLPLLRGSLSVSLTADSTQMTFQKAASLALLASWACRYNSTFLTHHIWKRRYFILTQFRLLRFKNCSPTTSCESALVIMPDTEVEILDRFSNRRSILQITTPSCKENTQSWHLQFESEQELQLWFTTIKSNISNFGYQNQLAGNRTSCLYSIPESKPEVDLHRRISTKSAPPHSRFRSKSYSWRSLPPQPPVPQYSPPAPPFTHKESCEGRARSQSTCSVLQRKHLGWEP
ncbi:hypothetical protein K493DRAFT_296266 [Basidiobolus meristosporus CBS 931.73]|uniref:PH domain-containing protein n=1 Tax=Basidiobolus meristosporus CBS 931.73 TaxID=1314790 RepID=A0A1Y1Z6V9_9FUNG|nr:hypothetical protein K493DRAFT_296266 [Basidiobolus meristosporus CBS 931.73]|eukprot:ORY05864.1 hypothetical protein K493DRAFT_296266 [Basidiobolus meristosporus CBS 931.73]